MAHRDLQADYPEERYLHTDYETFGLAGNSKRLSDQHQRFLPKDDVALLDDVNVLAFSYRKSSMSGTTPNCICIGHFSVEESMKPSTKLT
jgi:hypothetical protein